nr:uncharacterized protein LOC129422128 [Misgurnus anguillicaudatus]
MADGKDDDEDAITQTQRKRAPTVKGLEEKLHLKINARRSKLRQLTAKSNEIELLMENACNLLDVENIQFKVYKQLFEEFVEINGSVLLYLVDEEHDADQNFWFQPKLLCCKNFMEKVDLWIKETKKSLKMSQTCDNEVTAMDSISMVSCKSNTSNKSGSKATSVSKKSSISNASTARLKEEANRAALLAKAATLKERQELELKEAKLKAEMEKLEIETALAMSSAKIKVYQDCEDQQSYAGQNEAAQAATVCIPKLEQYECDKYSVSSKHVKKSPHQEVTYPSVPVSVRPKQTNTSKEKSAAVNEVYGRNDETSELQRVMQRQTDITAMLVKNQQMSCLPQRDVPLFHGDPLEFRSFMKAFKHAVDSKADSSADKLYFLEQYTRGEPRDLVKSCQHMPDDRGYTEAMKLLHEKFGNELQIATALMQKTLKWPEIKSEDGKSLSAFSLFLITCRNVMEDIEYMDELDNPTNMRIIISKLPYKLRERWRAYAYEYEEHNRRRAKFIQLVEFVDRQAKVISNPLFGDLDALAGDKKHTNKFLQGTKQKREGKKSSSFVTDIKQVGETQKDTTAIKTNSTLVISAFTKPCAFCEKNHTLEQCYQFGAKAYEDKLDFLRKSGFCFGCLVKGHLSKDCNRRSTCQLCAKKHPSMLHLTTQDKIPEKEMVKVEKTDVNTLPATVSHETSACTGSEDNCVLAIVPVKIKSRKSDKCVEVYAFMDPGSSATFCTDALARRLNVQGRKVDMMLSTMNSKQRVESYVLTDLEVSGLEENNFIELPKVFTQMSIPVSKENIPQQRDVDKWPYLSEVKLPHIDAEVEILIGNK